MCILMSRKWQGNSKGIGLRKKERMKCPLSLSTAPFLIVTLFVTMTLFVTLEFLRSIPGGGVGIRLWKSTHPTDNRLHPNAHFQVGICSNAHLRGHLDLYENKGYKPQMPKCPPPYPHFRGMTRSVMGNNYPM